MKRRLLAVLMSLMMVAAVICAGVTYFRFVSQTIYEESTAHLTEIFHQANQTLHNLISVNWSHMRMWEPYLHTVQSEDEIEAYLNTAQQERGFTDFYFISRNGDYLSLRGQRGYLNLREELYVLMLNKEPVVANSVVPDKPEIMVFAVPAQPGTFRDFRYEAIAITFNNSDVVQALEISAFDGQASTYAVLPDGRVVVDNSSQSMETVHNIFALLERADNLTSGDLAHLEADFQAGVSGDLIFRVDGKAYYLIYESANFENWSVLGIVPTNVVNASMNRLQNVTILVVSCIAAALMFVVMLLVVQRNRQKLKAMDHELLIRDELFSKLSMNVDDIFFMLDATSHRVEYVSPNMEKLLGLSEQEVREDVRVLECMIDQTEALQIRQEVAGMSIGQQKEWEREYTHQKTGESLWFRVIMFCTDIQGEKKYVLDMSDRTKDKLTTQRLAEAVHMAEHASRAKTTFLNNMSHDIRTPMNAIIGFTNIALKHMPKPEVRNCLEKIGESSEHLLTLINDVLDISRIESGKIALSAQPTDIREVASTVVSITSGFLTNRALHFASHLEEPASPYVLTDAVRIREILVNILGNAVKFTDDGGTITFEARYAPGRDMRHIVVRYRVSDTGVGMSEEFQQHLFDEFSQEENGARTQFKGTGLGMAITKRYVDMMGGTITVQSRKGHGSTFVVELPLELTDASRVHKEEQPAGSVDLSSVHVLMAEDNDLNAEIAMVQLEELGIHVTRVADGREAVNAIQSHPAGTFDMIFMDIMMPEMNGYEATRAIRALKAPPDAARIPIIAMTANAFAEDVQASLEAGMNGHLSKPIAMDEVVRAIAQNIKQ
ncbi:MAG: ATP-binding protein [Aristaeellaceae bacterium]